jgi:hypothetical protein
MKNRKRKGRAHRLVFFGLMGKTAQSGFPQRTSEAGKRAAGVISAACYQQDSTA